MRSRCVAVTLAAAGLAPAACAEQAVVLEIRGEGLDAPGDLDAFCLAVGDRDPDGGEFARRYLFGEGGLDGLPQTLTVDPGGASDAFAWVRGYRRGLEVARASRAFSFGGGDVALILSGCAGGPGAPPAPVDDAALPAGSLVVLSPGRTGSEVVAVGEGAAALVQARDGALAAVDAALPDAPASAPLDLVAFDADGDCDDDLLVLPGEGPAELWRRGADGSFAAAEGAPGATGARAAAAADVDGDGDIDLALARPDALTIWLNDGAGRFALHPTAVEGDGALDVTRLGFGDFDGDGAVDLAAGRGGGDPAATRILFNAGDGAFETVPAAMSQLAQSVRALAVRDMDGDGDADLVAAGADMPVRLYLGRGDGTLDDQSFPKLPAVDPLDAASLGALDWDGDCLADLVVGRAGGGEPLSWRGDAAGAMVDDGSPAVPGERVVLGDADDDGDADLVTVAGGDRLHWAAR